MPACYQPVIARNDADGVMTLEWEAGATCATVAREVLEELVSARNLAVTELGWRPGPPTSCPTCGSTECHEVTGACLDALLSNESADAWHGFR